MEKVNILGVKFDNVDMNEAIQKCQEFINSDGLNMIVTSNPEIIMLATVYILIIFYLQYRMQQNMMQTILFLKLLFI